MRAPRKGSEGSTSPPYHTSPTTLERVALVTGNYVNVADGVAMTLHRLVDALEARQVEVAVVAPDGSHPELTPPRRPISLRSIGVPIQQGYRLSLGLHGRTIDALERFQPQLIHVATPDLAGVMAARYAANQNLPLIGTYHTNFAAYLKYWGLLPRLFTPVAWELTKRFYSPFDRVYVPTKSLGDDLVKRGVLDDYSILARGVDQRHFHPCHSSEQWRREHGIEPDDTVVLFCARIVWEKGLRTLVRALDRLDQKGPDHRCVVVGDGDQKKWLQNQLSDAVFTGYLTGQDLSCAYASADLFVYPSTTDTFGNVTLEAMASGLPVVGARAPGTRSIVEEERTGLLVPPDDPVRLAEATARLLSDDRERRRFADAAVRRARRFRWPRIFSRFTADLDQLVERKLDFRHA